MNPAINIERLRGSELFVDPAVQRTEEAAHVTRLAREWRDEFVGVLIGSRRADDKVYILDGFQRVLAKTNRQAQPDYEFVVQVYTGLTVQQEAEIFLAHNRGRKSVSPYARFRVALTAGDPVAVALNEVVTSLGLFVGTRSTANTLSCISTMERIVGQMGKDIEHQAQELRWVLEMYRSVWGTTSDYWRTELVEGLAIFHKKYGTDPHYSDARLLKCLRTATVTQMLAAAKARALGSNRPSHAVAEVIQEMHDKGLKNRRLVAV